MTTRITSEEWLTELDCVLTANDDGMTALEIASELGWGRDKVYRMLHETQGLGRLRVGQRRTTGLNGHIQHVPVYKITADSGE